MNTREWIRKVTAYLKGEDYWAPIETVVEEREAQDSGKAPETTATEAATDKASETATTSKAADTETSDSTPERSILTHEELAGKLGDKARRKDWQKANYQAISTLLSIISISDQQAVENLEYAGDIWLYVTKK